MDFYKHSGAVPIRAMLLMWIGGTLTVVVAGTVYTFAIAYIPFIYINVLCTLIYGALIGAAVGWGAKQGKLRNNTVLNGLAVLFGLAGIYVEWGVDPLARIGLNMGLIGFHPQFLLEYAKHLYENGSWGVSENTPVTGMALGAVWIVEWLIILGTALAVARGWVAHTPFCERCDQWTNKEENLVCFASDSSDPIWDRLQIGDWSALDRLKFGTSEGGKTVRFHLATCPACPDSNFLTAQEVAWSVDKKGKVTEKSKTIFSHLAINKAGVEVVRTKAAEMHAENSQQLVAAMTAGDQAAAPNASG